MHSYRAEKIRPNYFDEYLGQVCQIKELTYRCGWCALESNDKLKVNSVFWNKYPQTAFCGNRCAEKWANNLYEIGAYPIPYSNYERHDYKLDIKVKKAWDLGQLTYPEQLEIAFWLRNLFTEYDVAFKNAGKQWEIKGSHPKDSEIFLKKLQEGSAFNLTNREDVIDFNIEITRLFYWNDISLREEIRKEYRMNSMLEKENA